MIYLDHNATTPVDFRVQQQIAQLLSEPLNPSSIHLYGRKGKNIIEEARNQIGEMVGVSRNSRKFQVIFTSSGTEANNLIITNFAGAEIFISSIEHVSIFEQQQYLPNIKLIKTNSKGVVDLDHLKELLSKSRQGQKLVSVMLANNETGIIQPIREIAKIAHEHEAVVHSDITGAAGKIAIDIKELAIDFATLSGHKFGGPMGAGALIASTSFSLKSQLVGGRQEKGMRAGTENVLAIAGLGLAAELARKELARRAAWMQNLQEKLEQKLLKTFQVKIIGQDAERLPNTTLLIADGGDAQTSVIACDLQGIAVSSGSACSSGKVGTSHVLKAMNLSDSEAKSAIRISTGYNQLESDIDNFIEICSMNEILRKI